MKRSFFFLQDSVTGQFYTGQHTYRCGLNAAAVYHSEIAAKSKMKSVINGWKTNQKYTPGYVANPTALWTDKVWAKEQMDEVLSHQDVANWGIVIVEAVAKLT